MIWIKIEIAGLWHVEISPKKGHEIRGLEVGRKEVFQDLINDNENYEYLKLIMPVWPANRASNTVLWSNKSNINPPMMLKFRFVASPQPVQKSWKRVLEPGNFKFVDSENFQGYFEMSILLD